MRLPPNPSWNIKQVERADSRLLGYYALVSLLAGPAFPVLLLVLYFRYHTLRYRFDDEGISMSWGILFRREIHLTYARIQDIHLVSNLVERFFGLARIQIQTASGQSDAQMTLEGILEFEAVRDHLYTKLRGASKTAAPPTGAAPIDALAEEVRAVSAELRALRTALSERDRG